LQGFSYNYYSILFFQKKQVLIYSFLHILKGGILWQL